jgi:hypothetical protein
LKIKQPSILYPLFCILLSHSPSLPRSGEWYLMKHKHIQRQRQARQLTQLYVAYNLLIGGYEPAATRRSGRTAAFLVCSLVHPAFVVGILPFRIPRLAKLACKLPCSIIIWLRECLTRSNIRRMK